MQGDCILGFRLKCGNAPKEMRVGLGLKRTASLLEMVAVFVRGDFGVVAPSEIDKQFDGSHTAAADTTALRICFKQIQRGKRARAWYPINIGS